MDVEGEYSSSEWQEIAASAEAAAAQTFVAIKGRSLQRSQVVAVVAAVGIALTGCGSSQGEPTVSQAESPGTYIARVNALCSIWGGGGMIGDLHNYLRRLSRYRERFNAIPAPSALHPKVVAASQDFDRWYTALEAWARAIDSAVNGNHPIPTENHANEVAFVKYTADRHVLGLADCAH